jgi:hypothetical protein
VAQIVTLTPVNSRNFRWVPFMTLARYRVALVVVLFFGASRGTAIAEYNIEEARKLSRKSQTMTLFAPVKPGIASCTCPLFQPERTLRHLPRCEHF